jgi:ABC-type transport system substrate-binding protein
MFVVGAEFVGAHFGGHGQARRRSRHQSTRWVNADYNKLYDQVKIETDAQKAAQVWMQLNDIVINAHISIPLIAASRSMPRPNPSRAQP